MVFVHSQEEPDVETPVDDNLIIESYFALNEYFYNSHFPSTPRNTFGFNDLGQPLNEQGGTLQNLPGNAKSPCTLPTRGCIPHAFAL